MRHPDPTKYLDQQFDKLMSLNPDREDLDATGAYAAAEQLGSEVFDHFRERTEKLLYAYVSAPWKRSERKTVEKYLSQLSETADHVLAARQITPAEPDADQSVALVPERLYTSLDWIQIIENAGISRRLRRAVDAASERNRLVQTVLPIAFDVLHCLDHKAAFEWELSLLEHQSGMLDADLVRDLINCWRGQTHIPVRALEWALRWSMDENLERQWPGVVAAADRLLRNHALRHWFRQHPPKSPGLQHLNNIFESERHSEKLLHAWLDAGVADVGRELKRCIRNSRSLREHISADDAAPLRASLTSRLTALDTQFVPVLLLADLLIHKPAGVYWLALATLGVSHAELRQWRKKLERGAYEVVQQLFIENLKRQISPEATIRRLGFGDKVLIQTLLNNLDLLTREFESMKDRNAVAEVLAVNYAGFRENALLAEKLTSRYRQVMSLLHEDTLENLLGSDGSGDEASSRADRAGSLRDLYSLIGDSRRYLGKRQSSTLSAEELVSVEIDFARRIRQQRFRLIRSLLLRQ